MRYMVAMRVLLKRLEVTTSLGLCLGFLKSQFGGETDNHKSRKNARRENI